ncbi:MAG: excinuclease ABC subunit UvrB [Fusobacteria bacterium]|nr:excinuclease ABC subunit UvrB [Fusobacteriota bacterium]
MSEKFILYTPFEATGDQPVALSQLTEGLVKGEKFQTLLGVTGSGKTFTIANVIRNVNKPTLVLAPNKTLAAQLYKEYKVFFPENRVEYFVSYYDYFQPESYVKRTDTYIEKEVSINDEIDRMRYSAIASITTRRDTIIVASVSAIYNLGDPKNYKSNSVTIGQTAMLNRRKNILEKLIHMKYERNDTVLEKGKFLSKGEILEISPMYYPNAYRIEFFDEDIERIVEIDPITKKVIAKLNEIWLLPNTFYTIPKNTLDDITVLIQEDKVKQVDYFKENNLLIEAQRINERVNYDCEMLKEIGYCKGIENYSYYLSDREIGDAPYSLMDFFPKDFLLVVDESHITIPQVRGMYNGDRSRKLSLVENGFRLPAALENRPLQFNEFLMKINQVIFVSATPADFELECTGGAFVEQLIRPTGLLDPNIEILPTKYQIDTLLTEMKKRIDKKEKVLVTTLTKKLAEQITDYYQDIGLRVRYLHSDVDTLDRIRLLEEFRNDEFDVIIGINLLREGLDIPEVSLVAILEADKEGFLRSYRSLIQTIGRAARNVNGTAILFADTMTKSIIQAVSETKRRREAQNQHNIDHNITPKSIIKMKDSIFTDIEMLKQRIFGTKDIKNITRNLTLDKIKKKISENSEKMNHYAIELNFEKAIELREEIKQLKSILIEL